MRWDSLGAGVLMGLLAPLLGFFGYAAIYVGAIRPHLALDFFIHDLFLGAREYQAPVLTLSLFANLALFFTLRWVQQSSMSAPAAPTAPLEVRPPG